jgi:hypothetical protein
MEHYTSIIGYKQSLFECRVEAGAKKYNGKKSKRKTRPQKPEDGAPTIVIADDVRGTRRYESQTIDLSAYTPAYRLLKEARESWDYTVCDKFVYCFDVSKVTLDFPIQIAKNYLEFGCPWIECHLTLKRQRELHYSVIVEFCEAGRLIRAERDVGVPRDDPSSSVNRDSRMFVDVAELIKSPQQMLSNCLRRRCIVRLKRFDDFRRLCGYTARLPVKSRHVPLFQDGELGVLGVPGVGIDFRQTPNQLVERRTQAIEKITKDKWDFVRDVLKLHPDDVQSIFSIIFTEKVAGFFTENSKSFPEVFKMYLRPGCLEIGIDQGSKARTNDLETRTHDVEV